MALELASYAEKDQQKEQLKGPEYKDGMSNADKDKADLQYIIDSPYTPGNQFASLPELFKEGEKSGTTEKDSDYPYTDQVLKGKMNTLTLAGIEQRDASYKISPMTSGNEISGYRIEIRVRQILNDRGQPSEGMNDARTIIEVDANGNPTKGETTYYYKITDANRTNPPRPQTVRLDARLKLKILKELKGETDGGTSELGSDIYNLVEYKDFRHGVSEFMAYDREREQSRYFADDPKKLPFSAPQLTKSYNNSAGFRAMTTVGYHVPGQQPVAMDVKIVNLSGIGELAYAFHFPCLGGRVQSKDNGGNTNIFSNVVFVPLKENYKAQGILNAVYQQMRGGNASNKEILKYVKETAGDTFSNSLLRDLRDRNQIR